MAARTIPLINAAENQVREDMTLEGSDLGIDGAKVSVQTLRGGKRDGVTLIEIDNGALRFSVCPTRGMGLWKGRVGDLEIGWQSPVAGPVHPSHVPVFEPGGLGWLEGFDEWMCRCGMESNGAPDFTEEGRLAYPLHGRLCNLPAQRVDLIVDDASGELQLVGEVDEVRFHFQKTRLVSRYVTTPGRAGVTLRDSVVNLSASAAGVQMLYHTNYGAPLLDPGSRLIAPVKTLVPRDETAGAAIDQWDSYAAEEPGFAEQVYFADLAARDDDRTMVLLKNAHGSAGATIGWNVKQLPCFTIWKNTTTLPDGYVTGLEPGLNFPNPRTYEAEQNRVVQLSGGKQLDFEVDLDVASDAAAVAAAEAQVRAIAPDLEPQIFDAPQRGWTPAAEG